MIAYAMWGCLPEITAECLDMTNASSTYLSILVGAIIGGLISWLIHTRQQKTAVKQDDTLERIKAISEQHDRILKTIESIEKHNKSTLDKILSIEKQIESLIEKRKKVEGSF